jgi:hypothetical protein
LAGPCRSGGTTPRSPPQVESVGGDYLEPVGEGRCPTGDRSWQLGGEERVHLDRDDPVRGHDKSQRERADARSDLEHHVVGPQPGQRHDAPDRAGVDD